MPVQRLTQIQKTHHIQNRRKGFLLQNRCVRCNRNHGRGYVVTTVRHITQYPFTTTQQLTALLTRNGNGPLECVEGGLVDQRPTQHMLITRITNTQRIQCRQQPVFELIGDGLV